MTNAQADDSVLPMAIQGEPPALAERLRLAILHNVPQQYGRFEALARLSAMRVSAQTWRSFWREKQAATVPMLEVLCRAWPHHALWMASGYADPKNGHHVPGATGKTLKAPRKLIRAMQETGPVPLGVDGGAAPYATPERWALLVGITNTEAIDWVRQGYIPTIEIGGKLLVNVEAARINAANAAAQSNQGTDHEVKA